MLSTCAISLLATLIGHSNHAAVGERVKVTVESAKRGESQARLEAQIQRGFELKDDLKADPTNTALLEQYVDLLGKVDFASDGEREMLTGPARDDGKRRFPKQRHRRHTNQRHRQRKRRYTNAVQEAYEAEAQEAYEAEAQEAYQGSGSIRSRGTGGSERLRELKEAQRRSERLSGAQRSSEKLRDPWKGSEKLREAQRGSEKLRGSVSGGPVWPHELEFAEQGEVDQHPGNFIEPLTHGDDKVTILAGLAEAGSSFLIREAQPLQKGVGRFLARWLTLTHDYAIEVGSTGKPKYMLSGKAWSLHQRFHLVVPGESKPRFTVRKAYGYYNPIGNIFGQTVYRILPYNAEPRNGGLKAFFDYHPKDAVLTITRDRLGRGAFWARQEWRVYEGHGGCWYYGLINCDSKKQLYYAMSKGWGDMLKYDMEIYKGPISALAGNGESGNLYGGQELNQEELVERKVAETKHESGNQRLLNWAITNLLELIPLPLNLVWHVAQSFWVDKCSLTFTQPADELLMTVLVALQDASNDIDKSTVAIAPSMRT